MTRRGIEYDFNITPFILEKDDFILYFSSLNNLKRFLDKYDATNEELENSLKYRYKSKFNSRHLSIIINYTKVEKRGFRIHYLSQRFNSLEEFNMNITVNINGKTN